MHNIAFVNFWDYKHTLCINKIRNDTITLTPWLLQAVIDRIDTLMADGTLTGVLDDRGKFIYITMSELESVAKFIKQRGRVSIQELAESSNCLIRLTPDTSVTAGAS